MKFFKTKLRKINCLHLDQIFVYSGKCIYLSGNFSAVWTDMVNKSLAFIDINSKAKHVFYIITEHPSHIIYGKNMQWPLCAAIPTRVLKVYEYDIWHQCSWVSHIFGVINQKSNKSIRNQLNYHRQLHWNVVLCILPICIGQFSIGCMVLHDNAIWRF